MACNNDNTLGPSVSGCRDDFDFTTLFEQVVFTLVPASIFIVGSFASAATLLRRPVIVLAPWILNLKLFVTGVFAALKLAIVVLNSDGEYSALSNAKVSAAAAAADFVAALCLIALSCLSHARSPRPSMVISLYLATTLLPDVATARTAWLQTPHRVETAYSSVLVAAVTTKAILVVLDSWHKDGWLLLDRTKMSPEATSSLASLGVFAWLSELLMSGYRGLLSLEMLYPLDHGMAADILSVRFQQTLKRHPLKGRRNDLIFALSKTLWKELMFPIVPRIVYLAASFCQPFLIDALLGYLEQKPHNRNHGYGLICATFLTYLTIGISTALYWYLQERFVIKVRGCLATEVYIKTTKLNLLSSSSSSVLTIMSTDIERTRVGILNLHEFWANLLQVGIACWLLQGQLGAAFAAPVVIVIIATGLASLAGRLITPRQRAWMEAIQARVSSTADAIAQMKYIKMSGMAKPVRGYIQGLRIKELALGSRWRLVLVFSSSIAQTPMLLAPVVTLAVTSKTLNTTSVFVSLSYLTLLASPMMVLLQKIPQLISALTCLERIQKFLEQEESTDFRIINNDERGAENAAPVAETEHQGCKSTPLQTLRSRPSASQCCISITNGRFGWSKEKCILTDVNISIPRNKLTVVVGPVGCGKSTLCKSFLGEIPYSEGTSTLFQSTRIGYCDQQPFLANLSIRDNVVGFNEFSEERYQRVLYATMLHVDLATLPLRDQTVVGSGGISLSGGQRQRLSIARALYAVGVETMIFDDVFSGLDATTEEHVFRHVLGTHGFTRQSGMTVVLCTHNQRHIASAHHLIRISHDGLVSQETSKPVVPRKSVCASEAYINEVSLEQHSSPVSVSVEHDSNVVLSSINADSDGGASSPVLKGRSARQVGDNTVYKYYLSSIRVLPLAIVLLSSVGFGFLENFPRVWLTYWTRDLDRGDGALHSHAYWIGIYGFLQMSCWIASVVTCLVVLTTFVSQSGAALHQTALSTIIDATLHLFTQTDVGVLVNYFSQDTNLIDTQLPSSVINVILEITTIIGMAALLASSSPWLALVYPALFAILWCVQHFYLRTSRQVRLLDLEAKSPLYAHFLDTLRGLSTIRAFGWLENSVTLNMTRLNQSQQAMYLLAMIQRWLNLSLSIVVAITATALVAFMTRLDANASISGASLVTLMTLSQSLVDFVTFYAAMETSIGAVTRIRTLAQTTESEKVPGKDAVPKDAWPPHGEIVVQNAWASYVDSPSACSLRGLSVNIRPGQKVALCGRSGSGKSSFILLLLALLEPLDAAEHSTRLAIDGESLLSIDRQSLREHLITIPQDPVFLPSGSTIAQNLDPFGAVSEEQCQNILEHVGLWSLVQDHGGSVDAVLQSSSLSQGQRQLFSLARAVLKRRVGRTSLLLLDEFTSSVDAATESRMMEIIMSEFRTATVIMVSHRLGVVVDMFDRVLIMDKGQLVEDGAPRTLAKTDGSWFAQLLESAKEH
ncbi:hypothetical protein LLEC1_04254 [Akanthomyces lecanii]|uniref:ABC transporter domain-containing protein n=1 Tax=Cordyceps confragosa TaxID=2714763 RepID=A0A179IJT2_CORDF|nr:hypothetical protein LLEC1_04254 [Akanthomyces lecanii]